MRKRPPGLTVDPLYLGIGAYEPRKIDEPTSSRLKKLAYCLQALNAGFKSIPRDRLIDMGRKFVRLNIYTEDNRNIFRDDSASIHNTNIRQIQSVCQVAQ
jgi:hypothetical protein